MLPEKCPECGMAGTVRRETLNFGSPSAIEKTYCLICKWNSGWHPA